jgi:hypothetical protein
MMSGGTERRIAVEDIKDEKRKVDRRMPRIGY